MRAYNFEVRGSSLTKLFRVTCREAGMIISVQIFGRLAPSPPKIWEGKNRPQFGAILDNFGLRSRISLERIKISKIGKASDQLRSIPRSTKINLVNFGAPGERSHQFCFFCALLFWS